MPIEMCRPLVSEQDIQAIISVLRSGMLTQGPVVREFEQSMAHYLGAKHAVAVSNGTAALHLAVVAAGVSAEHEVITTPFSFIASTNCFVYENAQPVFVDIDPVTFNIDPDHIEDAITVKTKAIVTTDIFGQPADADPINDIASRHQLTVIEDACEALGATYKNRKAGTLGDFAALGFYPNKQMTCGEGGMILTDRDDAVELLHSLRNQGRDSNASSQTHINLGYNYRLDEMSAALGLSQLSRIEELLGKRDRVAQMYHDRLSAVTGIELLRQSPVTTRMTWFAYIILIPEHIDRQGFIVALAELGIPSRAYFDPIHLQPYYRNRFGFKPGLCPVAERVAKRTLAIPFHGDMCENDIDQVCHAISKIAKRQTG